MTPQEFYNKVKVMVDNGEFFLEPFLGAEKFAIRHKTIFAKLGYACPILVVGKLMFFTSLTNHDFSEVGKALGLPTKYIIDVACQADNAESLEDFLRKIQPTETSL